MKNGNKLAQKALKKAKSVKSHSSALKKAAELVKHESQSIAKHKSK